MFIIERSTIMEKRNSLKMLFILIGIACVCNSCNLSKDNGFELEEFAIDNAGLHSVVDSVINMYSPVLQSTDEKKILSLNLSHKDSVLLFIFSIRDEEELLNRYIFRDNKRIVGYTTIGKEDIIFHFELIKIDYDTRIFKGILIQGETKLYKDILLKLKEKLS